MNIELYYSNEKAIQLFKSHGFSVEYDTEKGDMPVQGRNYREIERKRIVVVHPMSGERIDLETAISNLVRYKLLRDMYCTDKLTVLDALTKDSIREMKSVEDLI